MKRLLTAIVLIAALIPINAAAKVIVNSEGEAMRATTTKDFMRHKHKAKYYTESWTAILQSTEGHLIYINFLLTNLGVVEGSSGLSMSITFPGEQAKSWSAEHKVADFSDDSSKGMIKIGPNEMTLKGRNLTIKIDDNDMKLDLTMRGWYPTGYKFYDGKTFLNDKKNRYFYHFIHMPRGDFEAEMTWEGKTVRMKGAGYLDHMVNNRLTSEWSRRWWTVRYFAPNYTLAFITMQLDKKFGGETVTRAFFGSRTKPLALTDQIELKPSDLATDSKAGHKYHTKYDVSMSGDGFSLSAVFKSKRLHDRDGVIEKLPKIQQGIAKMFAGNPVTYRLEGAADVTVTEGTEAPKKLGGTAMMETIVIE